MLARAVLALVLATAAIPALAQAPAPAPTASEAAQADEVRALYDAMRLPGIVDVMAEEGVAYGADLAKGLFAEGRAPASWAERVAGIYDRDRMEAEVLDALAAALAGQDLAGLTAFFRAEPGATIAALELAGREAMLDDDVEQAAKEAAAEAVADDDPRLDLIRRYAEANDLIEINVAGALNTNYAYVMGLMDGGVANGDLTEEDVLADVRSREGQVRADTTEWVYSWPMRPPRTRTWRR